MTSAALRLLVPLGHPSAASPRLRGRAHFSGLRLWRRVVVGCVERQRDSSSKGTATGTSDFCKSLSQSLKDTTSLSPRPTTGNPSDLKALVEKAKQQVSGIVSAAPSAIKDDVQTLVNASESYYDALSSANYDLSKVDISKVRVLLSSNVQQASQRVSAYIQSHCGIDVGATP